MTLLLRSDAPTPFGANARKWGLNALTGSWDGAGSGTLYLDARTLYRNGNNMGVAFNFESGATATCVVSGCSMPIFPGMPSAELTAMPWTTITTLNNGARYFMDSPAVRMSLRLVFAVAAGRCIMIRG